jgi:DNA-binding XRE family transcriptional regulator
MSEAIRTDATPPLVAPLARMTTPICTGRQIRAARALIGLRVEELAQAASVHRNAVTYWEAQPSIPVPTPTGRHGMESWGCQRIRKALEARGIVFTRDPGPGVSLSPATAAASQGVV